MGYTHYWENRTQVIPSQALTIIKEITDRAYHDGLIQYEGNVAQPPLVNECQVRFNGVGDEGCETFLFDTNDDYRTSEGRPFACCKTRERPYDQIVMQVLIVLKHFLNNEFKISSDGDFELEWGYARHLMKAHYGVTISNDQL